MYRHMNMSVGFASSNCKDERSDRLVLGFTGIYLVLLLVKLTLFTSAPLWINNLTMSS